jgi:hypothetical protein
MNKYKRNHKITQITQRGKAAKAIINHKDCKWVNEYMGEQLKIQSFNKNVALGFIPNNQPVPNKNVITSSASCLTPAK